MAVHPAAIKVLVNSEVGEFFLQACHSREGGNPILFAKEAGCPPGAGMTVSLTDPSVFIDAISSKLVYLLQF